MSEDYQWLFDPTAFDQALSESKTPLPVFRKALADGSERLIERFHQQAPIETLIHGRAWLVDQLLRRAWRQYVGVEHDEEVALIAVGGYGRGELHPHSDIDLLVLTQDDSNNDLHESISLFLTFLWDIGVEVGHSVRSMAECVDIAGKDITVVTNLMETRLLSGSEKLFNRLRIVIDPKYVWPSRNFFEAKWKEQIDRHLKFHDTAYNLEPNVKEGPGALRDIQMIGWVTKRHFGAKNLHDLVTHNFLTQEEYEQLMDGQAFLWKVRFALHILANRHEERMLFDYQPMLAEMFAFKDEAASKDKRVTESWSRAADGHRLGVELFMKKYYRTIMQLRALNEMLLQLYQEVLLYPDSSQEPISINRRFQTRSGFIEAKNDDIFQRYPFALLEIFLLIQQNPKIKGIRASTMRLMHRESRLVNTKEFRDDIRCRSLFMEILRQPSGITYAMRHLTRYGILPAYIPSFAKIIGLMQYDLYHVYTVDQHTLFVVRNLRRFFINEWKHEFPMCSHAAEQVPKPELLYLAGLFHDIAKGRGGDHSILGAEEARKFCIRHELSNFDTELVAWLVENHLLMSAVAQHQDISDPEVVNGFANQVADFRRLDYLYLLTVADMRATNPKLWNSWKGALLVELYSQTRRALQRGLENPIDKMDRMRETQATVRKVLLHQGADLSAAEHLWKDISSDYFIRYNVEDIVWHGQLMAKTNQNAADAITIAIRTGGELGATQLFVYAPQRIDVFSKTTATLDQLNLNIVDARITASQNGYTLETYTVLENDGELITDPIRLHEIEQALDKRLHSNEPLSPRQPRDASRQIEHFSIPTEVSFTNDLRNDRTIMEVITTDRPGLLSSIASVLNQFEIILVNAKISTFGAQAEDVFFITDTHGMPLHDPDILRTLKQQITDALDSNEE